LPTPAFSRPTPGSPSGRANIFYACDSSGIGLSVDGGNTNDASNNTIYNVLFRNGYPLLDDWDPTKYGLMLARWVDDAAPTDFYIPGGHAAGFGK
jgi:hypothetical protein